MLRRPFDPKASVAASLCVQAPIVWPHVAFPGDEAHVLRGDVVGCGFWQTGTVDYVWGMSAQSGSALTISDDRQEPRMCATIVCGAR